MTQIGRALIAGGLMLSSLGCGDSDATYSCNLLLLTVCEEVERGDAPSQVVDLEVASATTSSVTLAWTQVGDGTGEPADYLVRYAEDSIEWSAANGTEVIVSGTAIGEPLSYEYTDLPADTRLEFQLAAFRLTSPTNALSGPLSNVVQAATFSMPSPLSAGTASANGGDGHVTLSATAPMGGSPPYRYQWYRSVTSGFTPASGNALVGLSTRNATDSTALNGTTYFYRLVATDGTRSAIYPEVSATPIGAFSLTPGTASASAGNGTVALSATAASGGVAPYSYQWHRSTTEDFTPHSGNALAGLTSLQESDSGLTNGATYYFRLVVTDAAGASEMYAEVSATPFQPNALHPNEPAGMTEICWVKGGIAYDGTNAFGSDCRVAGQWYNQNGTCKSPETWPDAVYTVSDPNNPTGSGSAVRLDFRVCNPINTSTGAGAEVGVADIFFDPPNDSTIYVAYRVLAPDSWTGNHGKDFYLCSVNGGGCHTNVPTRQSGGQFNFIPYDNNTTTVRDVYDGLTGSNEAFLEMVFTASTSDGACDATFRAWVNGVEVTQNEPEWLVQDIGHYNDGFCMSANSGSDNRWSGLHFWKKFTSQQGSTATYLDLRELYISGKGPG